MVTHTHTHTHTHTYTHDNYYNPRCAHAHRGLIIEVAKGPVPVAKFESLESRLDHVREKRVKLNLISRVGYGAGVDAGWAP